MTEQPTSPDLPPDYYLSNFRFLVDWVWARYVDLLNDHERQFIQRFLAAGRDAQCLLVRLSSRKGPLFRRDKLHYDEISDVDAAARELITAGLLHNQFYVELEVLSRSLTKAELLTLFQAELTGMKQARKEQLIQRLQTTCTEPRDWEGWTKGQLGEAFYLDNQAIINNLLLLFFGNAHQDLTEFVLQDLGLFRYEKYSIDPEHRAFGSRSDLDMYWQLLHLRDQLELADSSETLIHVASQLPPLAVDGRGAGNELTNEKIQRRWAKLANQMAYELERTGEYGLALRLYEQSHLPPARERRVRLLEKQQDYIGAWKLLDDLLAHPQNEQELQIAWRMAPRLAKKLPRDFSDIRSGPPDKRIPVAVSEHHICLQPVVNEEGSPLRVEEVVRLSVASETSPCVYAENELISGLFGLWLWPEMFRGVKGAFANPFQAAPLDIYQENFVAQRPGIEYLWALLDSDEYQTHILRMWEEKFGITNHFVTWHFLSRDLLSLALQCIPAAHLKIIFKRLLFDIKNNRSGLPDLIQFYPLQKTYRMIEVKGPGDRIQDNQQRWLEYFSEHTIPAEVWYVRWH